MKERHLLALSGGKDSAALAVYMREKYPHLPMEYVFIDSGCELPETEEYLDRIQASLSIKIIRIGGASFNDRRDFEWWLKEKNYYLPSPNKRWCTDVLKLSPYAKWLAEECNEQIVYSYVGLRADEKRERLGYVTANDKLIQKHPFIEDGLAYDDIRSILEDSGIGFPAYYSWRSRSGCYFCFYQTKREWLGLYDNHPDLFWKAEKMEKMDIKTGKKFTWCEDMPLSELVKNRQAIDSLNEYIVHGKEKVPKLSSTLSETVRDKDSSILKILKTGA